MTSWLAAKHGRSPRLGHRAALPARGRFPASATGEMERGPDTRAARDEALSGARSFAVKLIREISKREWRVTVWSCGTAAKQSSGSATTPQATSTVLFLAAESCPIPHSMFAEKLAGLSMLPHFEIGRFGSPRPTHTAGV